MRKSKKMLIIAAWGSSISKNLKAKGIYDVEVLHCQISEWGAIIASEIRQTKKDVIIVFMFDRELFDSLNQNHFLLTEDLSEFSENFEFYSFSDVKGVSRVIGKINQSITVISQILHLGQFNFPGFNYN